MIIGIPKEIKNKKDPPFIIDDVVLSFVANMPKADLYTFTIALTNATLPYAVKLSNQNWKNAYKEDKVVGEDLNIINGQVVYQAVGDAFNMPVENLQLFLN